MTEIQSSGVKYS